MSRSAMGFVIGALIVALIALAYIYWKDENTISIGTSGGDLPKVEVNTQ